MASSNKKAKSLFVNIEDRNNLPLALLKKNISKAPFDTIIVESQLERGEVDEKTWGSFFSELGKIQTKRLQIRNHPLPYGLASAFQQPQFQQHLQTLEVKWHSFGGFIELRKALPSLSALQHISFKGVGNEEIFWAFLQLPSLKSVDLTHAIHTAIDFRFLKKVVQAPLVRKLELKYLFDVVSIDNHLISATDWLIFLETVQNCTLQSLKIDDDNLRRLICCAPRALRDVFMQAMAAFSTVNQSLQELTLAVPNISCVRPLIVSLQTSNRTLRQLSITTEHWKKPDKNFDQDAIAMLKDNPILRTFQVVANGNLDWKKPKAVRDYLCLNKAGRDSVLKGEMTNWVEALASCSRNVSGLFFFLRHKPDLLVHCNLSEEEEPNKKKPAKKKRRRKY